MSLFQQNYDTYLPNAALIEKARGIWLRDSKQKSEELVQLLIDTFNSHSDVYSFLLCALERTGKNRLQKHDIRRIIATEFLVWREKKEDTVPRCQPSQQVAALEILERCHHVLFDDICTIFDLHSAEKRHLLSLIDCLTFNYRHTEVRFINYFCYLLFSWNRINGSSFFCMEKHQNSVCNFILTSEELTPQKVIMQVAGFFQLEKVQ